VGTSRARGGVPSRGQVGTRGLLASAALHLRGMPGRLPKDRAHPAPEGPRSLLSSAIHAGASSQCARSVPAFDLDRAPGPLGMSQSRAALRYRPPPGFTDMSCPSPRGNPLKLCQTRDSASSGLICQLSPDALRTGFLAFHGV
jgi:hypothetical protein